MEELKNRQFIAERPLIEQLKQQFHKRDQNENNWTTIYEDTGTGDKWLYYYANSEYHGGGYPIFGRLPFPDTEKLIEIALHTDIDDEVFAACILLTDNEQIKKKKFREDLIDQLEKLNNKERQKRIISLTGLDSPLNKYEILGKTANQVKQDAKHFQEIADRAKKLKQ